MHLTKPRRLLVGSLACVLLAGVCSAGTLSVERAWRASAIRTSRWFKFDCGKEQASPCVLTVRLRGPIDRSHLRLFEEAVRWRDGAQRALDRPIELQYRPFARPAPRQARFNDGLRLVPPLAVPVNQLVCGLNVELPDRERRRAR